jgi:Ferritin-like
MSMQALMKIPAVDRDVQWLAYSLQEAIQLEWATIPPYLCAYWSIKTGSTAPASTKEIAVTIVSIAIQEMLHMGLACNMLAGLGGTPNIYSANFAPKYPSELPGHVHPGLTIGLAGLSRDVPGSKDQVAQFLEIELPEQPLARAKRAGFATIGEFYDAVSDTFDQVKPTFDLDRQLTSSFLPDLTVLHDYTEAKAAIGLIKRQGEGTSSSPFASDKSGRIAPAHELAHYYRFGEIYHERRLVPDSSAPHGWSFTGTTPPLDFPDAQHLYLMAEVPAAGYSPESDAFDRADTAVLKQLHDAWAQGDGSKLDAAIISMDNDLSPAAVALLDAGHPTGSGQGIKGPDFRFLP